jgi:serine/threonine-protein kinase
VGSVDYISPEQIKGGKVDARTDLYALGVLGYRLLTGKSPFVYPNIAALVKQKGELEGPHPQRANPDVPSDLDRIVSQLMSSDAARRPGPAGRLRRDLEQIRAIPERE